jgi:hypothetical protein
MGLQELLLHYFWLQKYITMKSFHNQLKKLYKLFGNMDY